MGLAAGKKKDIIVTRFSRSPYVPKTELIWAKILDITIPVMMVMKEAMTYEW
jgi:hypothetical protein